MQVLKAPNPLLRAQTKPVKKITPALLQTFKEMIRLTKIFKDPEGVGLASTQIGLDGQFFVAKIPDNTRARGDGEEGVPARSRRSESDEDAGPTPQAGRDTEPAGPRASDTFITVINPKIIWTSKKTKKYFEGCLSIPNYWGEIERYSGIKVTYQDETGKVIKAGLKGTFAWIFQHEMDHLEGIIFPDRVLEQKGKFYKNIGKDKTGTDIFEEIIL